MNEPCYYRVSVKAIAIDETCRFLLTRETDGCWDLIGGGLEHGEDPIEGLKREIHEETGLVVTYVSPSPKYFTATKRLSRDSYVANIIYEVKLQDLNFTPSDECQELRFFTPDEARGEQLLPNTKRFVDVFQPELHLGT